MTTTAPTISLVSPKAVLSRWTRRIATLLMSLVAAVALAFGMAVPAAAAIERAGTVQPVLTCAPGSIVISPFVSVQNGYVNGQYIVYRYNLQGSNGSRAFNVTSGWSGATFVPYANSSNWGTSTIYGTSMLPQARIAVARGGWEVRVQVGYWNGGGYVYSGWTYQHSVNGYDKTWAVCAT